LVNKTPFIFILVFLFSGCAVKSRQEQKDFRKMFTQREFEKAKEILDASSIKKDEKNHLLFYMESASLKYAQGRFHEAAQIFVQANELVDVLYTKSVKELLASSIFERSLLYQYQALSFYHLARRGYFYQVKKKDGKDIEVKTLLSKDQVRSHYNRVRSTLIAWDSFFQEMARMGNVKTFLKHDLLAKQMAATLHEVLATKRDKEIALQLFKSAYQILLELGPTQKVFNKNYEKYNADLKRAYNKGKKGKSLKSKKLTKVFGETKNYLTYKILTLTKKIRRSSYAKTLRRYKPSLTVKRKLKSNGAENISIIIEKGLISELKGKDFTYNLRSAVDSIESPTTRNLVNGIGVPILTYFALGPLGLGFASHHGNTTVYSRHSAGEMLTKEVGLEFELPSAKASDEKNNYQIEVFQKEKKVLTEKLVYMSSLSDISFINSQEMIENSFKKRGTRVGLKYITAILAAYATYKKMQDVGGELFAKPAALTQFLISQKAIKETEKADARHWTSLPGSLLTLGLKLIPGKYTLYFVERSPKTKQELRRVKLDFPEVKTPVKTLFSYRTL